MWWPSDRLGDGRLLAAGIEPVQTQNPNPLMAYDFGFYDMKTIELPRRYLSSRVPSRPLESSTVLEIFWRRLLAVVRRPHDDG